MKEKIIESIKVYREELRKGIDNGKLLDQINIRLEEFIWRR